MDQPNWLRIAVMCVLPLALALPAAFALWRRREVALGNIAGMGIIFVIAVWLIILEYAELGRWMQTCLDQGHVCEPTPSGFVRYAIYAGIGVIEVFVLFSVSLKVEERDRNSGYAPEWKR
jgi:hypothetical protein